MTKFNVDLFGDQRFSGIDEVEADSLEEAVMKARCLVDNIPMDSTDHNVGNRFMTLSYEGPDGEQITTGEIDVDRDSPWSLLEDAHGTLRALNEWLEHWSRAAARGRPEAIAASSLLAAIGGRVPLDALVSRINDRIGNPDHRFDRSHPANLADTFRELMQDAFKDEPEKLAEMDHRNRTVYAADPQVCASHDFCDANMVMAQAFEQVFGRESDVANAGDAAIWSRAWSIARAKGFSVTA